MSDVLTIAILGFLGLCFGSFAGAQVWRLRARQLEEDKKLGEAYDKIEYKKLHSLAGRKQSEDRSQCLHCGHVLAWYDLVPLASWLSTRGRCRYCRKSIGFFEPLIELGMASFFVVSYVYWPVELHGVLEWGQFATWLIVGVLLGILFAYDSKWFILPDKIVYPTIVASALYWVLGIHETGSALIAVLGAIAILSGLYFVLWVISKGRWIGFGDVKLGVALGFLTGSWELAFLALFLANLIGCIVVIPGLISKKMTRTTQVPFGPMLIAGTVITVLFGQAILTWYTSVATTMLML